MKKVMKEDWELNYIDLILMIIIIVVIIESI